MVGGGLSFDALIGNTDRHPENWGFLKRVGGEPNASWALAPAFDNGTSLGYQIREERLLEFSEPIRLEAYVNAGRHHCGWDVTSDHRTPHMDLCHRLLDAFPAARGCMQRAIAIDRGQVEQILGTCSHFDVSVPFSCDRAYFVAELIEARRRRLLAIVGS